MQNQTIVNKISDVSDHSIQSKYCCVLIVFLYAWMSACMNVHLLHTKACVCVCRSVKYDMHEGDSQLSSNLFFWECNLQLPPPLMAARSAPQVPRTRKGTPDRIFIWILPAEWQVSLLPLKSNRCVTWPKECLAKTERRWEWSVKGCVNLLDTWLGQFTRLFVFGVRQADLLQSNHKVLFAEKPNLFIVLLLMKTTVRGIEK